MEIGMVGLGRMGGAMAQRLLRAGHNVVAYDPRPEAVQSLEAEGSSGASSLAELASKLTPLRAVWIMAPVGAPTESAIEEAAAVLQPGDIIIDGGNSNYRDSMRRAAKLAEAGISFLDVGTSGGIWGLTEGYSLMVGGDPEVYSALEPIFRALAPGENRGHGYVGKAGAGHFVKMVHNAVEYGLMEAYAEGFELLQAKEEFGLDLAQVAGIWRHGSVVRSWLLDLTAAALAEDAGLEGVQSYVEDSGEGRWAVEESVELGVPAPVIALALQARFRSRQQQPFAGRLLAAMRNQFGGHEVRRAD